MNPETILSSPSETDLAHAVEENLFALFQAMADTLRGGECVQTGRLSYHVTFPTNPMFKGVWRTRLLPKEADQAIEETIARFKDRRAPYFFWWAGPGTQPADLGARLQSRGLLDVAERQQELAGGIRQTDLGAPCLVADLLQMDESLLTRTPPGFVIKEIDDEKELFDFKKVIVETFEIPDWAGQAWVDATLSVGIGRTPWQMFVGYLGDEPVSTSMLFNGGGVTGVYAVATVPVAQRKGIGAAITLQSLLEAREVGYKYAALYSTEIAIPVYQRIGFRLTGARINRYMWRSEQR